MEIDKPLITGVVVILIFLIIFFFVWPKYQEFKGLQLSLEEKKADFNARYEYYANISDVFHTIEERKDDFVKIDDALPNNPNLGKLSYYFQTESQKDGLVLKNISLSKLSPRQEEGGPGEIIFSIDLFGNYSSLLNFIISIEKSAKLFELFSISFKSPESQTGSVSGTNIKSNELFDFTLQVKTNSY